ncbi:MAG: DUF222 domain-containing protein [Nocardioides sp.]
MSSLSHSSGRHPVLACADAVEDALKDVAGVEPAFMSIGDKAEALVRLTRLADQVESLRLRVMAVSDDVAAEDGARSVAAWLSPRVTGDYGPAAASEHLATALDGRWRRVGAAVADGRVSVAAARVVVRALEELPAEVDAELRDRAEAHLVGEAERYTPQQLRRLGTKVLEVIAPETYDDHERRRLEAAMRRAEATTRVTLRDRGDGSVDVRARVPEATAVRLRTYLEAFGSPRHDDAGGRSGAALLDPATGRRLPHDRVLGLAFCSLLEALDPALLPAHGGAATQVVVTMPLVGLQAGTGVGILADGTPVTAGDARRLACTAAIIPAVLGGASEVLDLGRSRRLFSTAQRKALALAHPQCQADGCTVPATWCEAHHARDPWSCGGRTDLADGTLLCGWHHRRAHDDRYDLRRLPNGDFRFHRRE